MANDSSGYGAEMAGAAVTALGNYAITAASNKRQFKFQQQAMDKQLSQNKELWDYQNAYNTPQQQMSRLEAAGLNPRLIYGSSSSGGLAGPIAPADVPARQATKFEGFDPLMRYLQVRQMDAQYAATRQNIEMAQKRGALTDVQTALANLKEFEQSARSKNFKELASAELDTKKFIALRSGELFGNERTKGAMMDQTMELRGAQLTGVQLDNEFKRNRNELAKYGVYSTDHPIFRALIQGSKRMGISLEDMLKMGMDKLKYLFE